MNNKLIKILLLISMLFICGCLNFFTNSSSTNNDGIDKKYIGTYQGQITTIENNNIQSQNTANVTVGSGGFVQIRISGSTMNLMVNIYKEDIIKVSDNLYKASATSSGYIYNFSFSFNNNWLNLYFTRSDNSVSEGNLNKIN